MTGASLPACAILLDLEGINLGLAGRNGALGDTRDAIVDAVVQHADTMPVDGGSGLGMLVRRSPMTVRRNIPINTQVVCDCHTNSIAPISPNSRARKLACSVVSGLRVN